MMSDRVAVMAEGVIQQVGPPSEIYCRPVNETVANFVGELSYFTGSVTRVDDESS